MKKFLFYFLILEAAFLLEGTVRHFPLTSVRVDFVWLVVLYLGFNIPLFPGGLFVFTIGFIQEAVGAPLHGILPFSYLIVYYFLRLTHHHLFFEGGLAQIVWVVLLTFLQKGVESVLFIWQGYPPALNLPTLLAAAVLNGFVSLPLFSFLKKGGRISPAYAT